MKNKKPKISFNHSFKVENLSISEVQWIGILMRIEDLYSEIRSLIFSCHGDIKRIDHDHNATLYDHQRCVYTDHNEYFDADSEVEMDEIKPLSVGDIKKAIEELKEPLLD